MQGCYKKIKGNCRGFRLFGGGWDGSCRLCVADARGGKRPRLFWFDSLGGSG
jgi:hypothetical protein